MKTQDMMVSFVRTPSSKKLQKMDKQTVTVLHGSLFRDHETGNILAINNWKQNLVYHTQQETYLILNRCDLHMDSNIYDDNGCSIVGRDNFEHKLRTVHNGRFMRFEDCAYQDIRPEDKIVRDLYGNPVSEKRENYIRERAEEARANAFTKAVEALPQPGEEKGL